MMEKEWGRRKNAIRKLLSAGGLCLLLFCDSSLGAQPYIGDSILQFASTEYTAATLSSIQKRMARLIQAMKLPEDEVANFPDARNMKMHKFSSDAELDKCIDEVIIVQGGVKISFAQRCIILARGTVSVSFVDRTIVVAQGAIKIAHDAPSPRSESGIYVTKGSLRMSSGKAPYIYALGGAETCAPAMTTFNTEHECSSTLPQATHNVIEPIFGNESRRKDIGKSFRLDSREFISYTGRRCIASTPDVSLFSSMLPSVRKQANCQNLESANVTCEMGNGFESRVYAERWVIAGCGKQIRVNHQGTRLRPGAPGEFSAESGYSSIMIYVD